MPFTPPDATSATLKQWFKSDAGVYKDAGVTLAADGETVQQWNDQSGNGNNATQGTAGNRPTLRTNVVNGLPAIDFIATRPDFFDVGGPLSGATAGEIFLVLKINTDPPAVDTKTGIYDYSAADFSSHYTWTDGIIYDSWGATVRKTTVDPSTSLSSGYRIYSVRAGSSLWKNVLQAIVLSETTSNTVTFRASGCKLGRSLVTTYNCDGRIAEVIVYNGILSGADRGSVYDYLNTRYAFSLNFNPRFTRALLTTVFEGQKTRFSREILTTVFEGQNSRFSRLMLTTVFEGYVQAAFALPWESRGFVPGNKTLYWESRQTPQIKVPSADISVGNWHNEVGSQVNLYQSVDEGAVPNDSDYVYSKEVSSEGDSVEFNLVAVNTPFFDREADIAIMIRAERMH